MKGNKLNFLLYVYRILSLSALRFKTCHQKNGNQSECIQKKRSRNEKYEKVKSYPQEKEEKMKFELSCGRWRRNNRTAKREKRRTV